MDWDEFRKSERSNGSDFSNRNFQLQRPITSSNMIGDDGTERCLYCIRNDMIQSGCYRNIAT